MLRRWFLKLLGAAIVVPWIGGPARRLAQRIAPIGHSLSKWNLWIGEDDGKFDDPQCWSHKRVPGDGDCVVLDTGTMTVPGGMSLERLTVIGPGHIFVEANPVNAHHSAIGTFTVTQAATEAGCTIGTQGRAL